MMLIVKNLIVTPNVWNAQKASILTARTSAFKQIPTARIWILKRNAALLATVAMSFKKDHVKEKTHPSLFKRIAWKSLTESASNAQKEPILT